MSISITPSGSPDARLLGCAGEIDVSNAAVLRDALNQAFDEGATSLEADLAEVSYIDSTGIGVLVGAAHRAKESGVSFTVSHPQRNVERVLSLLGVAGELGVDEAR